MTEPDPVAKDLDDGSSSSPSTPNSHHAGDSVAPSAESPAPPLFAERAGAETAVPAPAPCLLDGSPPPRLPGESDADWLTRCRVKMDAWISQEIARARTLADDGRFSEAHAAIASLPMNAPAVESCRSELAARQSVAAQPAPSAGSGDARSQVAPMETTEARVLSLARALAKEGILVAVGHDGIRIEAPSQKELSALELRINKSRARRLHKDVPIERVVVADLTPHEAAAESLKLLKDIQPAGDFRRESDELVAARKLLWATVQTLDAEIREAESANAHIPRKAPGERALGEFLRDRLKRCRSQVAEMHALCYANTLEERYDAIQPLAVNAIIAARSAGIRDQKDVLLPGQGRVQIRCPECDTWHAKDDECPPKERAR